MLKLIETTGVTVPAAERAVIIDALNQNTQTRASVLRHIVDGTFVLGEGREEIVTFYGKAFYDKIFNQSFVQMEYFGYMRRDPDEGRL